MADFADYQAFVHGKTVSAPEVGFEPSSLRSFLFPFQRAKTAMALRRGRAAMFAECGMGKTAMELAWADAVARHTGLPVLILAPLAVAQQTVREATKFGFENVGYATDDSCLRPGTEIIVTNYERLKGFDPSFFSGVVLDESGILKAYTGTTKRALVEAFARTPYRLACSATPAPNDHLELGNHSEFLSVLSSHQMIARWFVNDFEAGSYRLKGYAVDDFWDWVSSWATAFVAASYSFEAYYQAIRRFWRFGQTRPVHAHMVMGATERTVLDVLTRKRDDFERMKVSMMAAARRRQHRKASDGRYCPSKPLRIPAWLRSEVTS
jgi:hypothetical protein